jgi:sulfite exporter TauE/SafE
MISLELLGATLFSSLVGSMHCVGMCSPFAMLAMGSSTSQLGSRQRGTRLAAYHVGRLTTYVTMGIVVATLSASVVRVSGGPHTSQTIAWLAGIIMIGLGISRLVASLSMQNHSITHSPSLQYWTKQVITLRKRYSGVVHPVLAAYLWGATSTLLPCGWLYMFVLASATALSFPMIVLMMVAFWIGTLPLLSVSAWSWGAISPQWQRIAQPFAALCIISFGLYTVMHRTQVDVRTIANPTTNRSALESIRDAMNADLPCCVGPAMGNTLNPNDHSSGSHFASKETKEGLAIPSHSIGVLHARNP